MEILLQEPKTYQELVVCGEILRRLKELGEDVSDKERQLFAIIDKKVEERSGDSQTSIERTTAVAVIPEKITLTERLVNQLLFAAAEEKQKNTKELAKKQIRDFIESLVTVYANLSMKDLVKIIGIDEAVKLVGKEKLVEILGKEIMSELKLPNNSGKARETIDRGVER